MISKPSINDRSFFFDHVNSLKELLEEGLGGLVRSLHGKFADRSTRGVLEVLRESHRGKYWMYLIKPHECSDDVLGGPDETV